MLTISGNFGNTSKILERIERNMPDTSKRILNEASLRLKKSAKMRARRDTGTMRSTIRTKVSTWEAHVFAGGKKTTRTRGKVSTIMDYAYYQEMGFRPHMVSPFSLNPKSAAGSSAITSWYVSRFTSFMRPALFQYFPRGLELTIRKHIGGLFI